jgi:hypothetical protein
LCTRARAPRQPWSLGASGEVPRAWATTLGRRLTAIRGEIRDPRDARAARKSLADELATYTSASDLNDLDAILDRYSDEETADIRRILATRRVA